MINGSTKLGVSFLIATLAMHGQQIIPNAQRQILALLSEKASRTAGERKMSAHLVHAAKVLRGERSHADFPTPSDALAVVGLDSRKQVEVDIRADVTPELLAFISNLGGAVVNAFPGDRSIRARLPLLAVERVAERPTVSLVRTSEKAVVQQELLQRRGSKRRSLEAQLRKVLGRRLRAQGLGRESRALGNVIFVGPDASGDIAHQADVARATYGVDGTGVKVGVISSGVDSLATEQAGGRLPVVNVLPGQTGSGDEGTAILEIVYTLTPGSTLYFATANGGQASMANNIQALADSGCKIILDDIVFPPEGVFEDGIIAQKVNAVAAAGVLYFSAVGNKGSLEDRNSDTWEGDFADSGVTLGPIPGTASIQSFGGFAGNRIVAPSSAGIYSLNWSDPFGKSANDYDLFILNQDLSAVVAFSTDIQDGTQDPQEHITDPSHRVIAGDWIVVVRNTGAAARALHLDTWFGRIAQMTNGNAFGHNAAAAAFSIGAVDVHSAFGSAFMGAFDIPVEAFSSAGPRRMFIQPDGTAITPGNFLFSTSGGLLLNKPDFVAADGVTTGAPPPFNLFYGTSAAVPHAAAIAALVLQANPSITAAAMRIAFSASALPVALNGGAGIVMAPAAIAQAPAKCTYSIGAGGQTYSSDSGQGSIAITAAAICPWSVSVSDAWIIPDGSSSTSGMGSGTISYQVAANPGEARWGTITIADQVFTIEQGSFNLVNAVTIGTLAQVVSAGNWKMTLDYFNLGTTSGQLQTRFFSDSELPMALPFTFPQLGAGGSLIASTLERSLPAGAQFVMETTGPASQLTQVGWGQLLGTGNLSGFGIFSDSATNGEAVVPLETRNAAKYILAFDNTGGLVTGVAIANSSPTVSFNGLVIVRDDKGAQIGAPSIGYGPLAHGSFVLNDMVPETAGKRGTLEFDVPDGGQISLLEMRFTPTSLFTTVPVLADVTAAGGLMADVASGGGWTSAITLVNTGSLAAHVHLHFYDDSGKPLFLPVSFPQTGASMGATSVDQTLAANASVVIETTGPESQAVQTGWVQFSTDGKVGGFMIFHRTTDGQEAVVPLESRSASAYVLPFDNTNGLVTGVAVANSSGQAANFGVVIRDDTGAQIGTGVVALAANGHTSFVLTDRFSVVANKRGTVEFDATVGGQVSVLGLRFTAQGFTTIPVFAK